MGGVCGVKDISLIRRVTWKKPYLQRKSSVVITLVVIVKGMRDYQQRQILLTHVPNAYGTKLTRFSKPVPTRPSIRPLGQISRGPCTILFPQCGRLLQRAPSERM